MAPRVTTLLTVARTGTRVVRYLIRPAVREPLRPDGWGLDTLPPALALRRSVGVARRAAGLGVLTLVGLLGTSVLTLSTIFLGISAAAGNTAAVWVLGLALLLGVAGAVWLSRRASALLRSPAEAPGTAMIAAADLDVLADLHRAARALPAPRRSAYRRTLGSAADALRACATDTTLGRDTFDARQAAQEDLPELLRAYRAAPGSPGADREFTRQLTLIETRMQTIVQGRAGQHSRDLHAHGRYLDDKYGGKE
ncbi:hypothetical protein [Deinococcus sp.]|uniref:hypothetical protein n=1 Tax=Deinococcus sp. TaxID=47478 RepID=UPI002869EB8D|nr:hypothetical protein [Deinococcus sp.]